MSRQVCDWLPNNLWKLLSREWRTIFVFLDTMQSFFSWEPKDPFHSRENVKICLARLFDILVSCAMKARIHDPKASSWKPTVKLLTKYDHKLCRIKTLSMPFRRYLLHDKNKGLFERGSEAHFVQATFSKFKLAEGGLSSPQKAPLSLRSRRGCRV